MSAPKRRNSTGLIDQLFENPHRFEFFQAVRLLDAWLKDTEDAGVDLLPRQLRFRNSTALSFPPSEIEALKILTREAEHDEGLDGRASIDSIEVTPAFMGLLGLSGALPLVYTEQIVQRELRHKDFAARNFLDIFSNRAIALFYAAWKKNRLHLQYETNRESRFAPMALALAGVGQNGLRGRLKPDAGGVRDDSLAFFAGALQQRTLSAKQMEQLLRRYLGVPVKLEQFVGRWYTLPTEAHWSLGGGNGMLGRNTIAGGRVWQRDLCVRVVLGPLDRTRFQRFLPGAPGAVALREVLTLLSGVSFEYEINLVLKAASVEGISLGSTRSSFAGRLGWDTYLQTRPHPQDRCDVHYDVQPDATA